MKDVFKGFKIIIVLFAILGFALCIGIALWMQFTKARPTMNEDELQIFDDYVVFDGNLFCVDAEEYLGTTNFDIDATLSLGQDYYKIEGVAVSDMVLSYTRRTSFLVNDDKTFSVLCGKQTANPLFKWEIDSIEICDITANYSIEKDDISDPEGYQTIIDYSVIDLEATRNGFSQNITDKDKIELFISSVKAHYDSKEAFVDADLKKYLSENNDCNLKVRVNFSNSSNVVWIAPIYIDERDGQVYLQISKSVADTKGLETEEHWIPVNLSVSLEGFQTFYEITE